MAKTTKKQAPASKWQTFNKTINIDSGPKRLVTVAIIFALIGGTYMVYKSFAQSVTKLANVDQIVAISQPAQKKVEQAGSKRSFTVWSLGTNGSVRGLISLPYMAGQSPFKICANLKAAAAGTVTYTFYSTSQGNSFPVTVKASADYVKYCYPLTYQEAFTTNAFEPGVFNGTGGELRVSWISLEYDSQYVSYGSYATY